MIINETRSKIYETKFHCHLFFYQYSLIIIQFYATMKCILYKLFFFWTKKGTSITKKKYDDYDF